MRTSDLFRLVEEDSDAKWGYSNPEGMEDSLQVSGTDS